MIQISIAIVLEAIKVHFGHVIQNHSIAALQHAAASAAVEVASEAKEKAFTRPILHFIFIFPVGLFF